MRSIEMSRLSLVVATLSFLVSLTGPQARAEEWEWLSLDQVEHVTLAVQLADYPFPQGHLKSVIGMHKLPHLGGSWDERDRCYGIIALTNPEASGGYYAVRVVYGDLDPLPKPEDIPIVELQVLFQVRSGLSFVHEPHRTLKRMIPDLRKSMKEKNAAPIAFAESFLPKPDFTGEERMPNQPAQPTRGKAPRG